MTPRLPVGTVVAGKYRVAERLGGGGMGEVYRAENQLAGRTVALKLLRPDFAEDTNFTRRFFLEAQAVNKIRHPNIVDVLDAGFSDHGPYVVMECLEGVSLSAALSRTGRLPQTTALAVVLPMLEALDAAHRVGIVHRDLKPENVFLSHPHGQKDVRIKLLDFGIAKVLDTPETSSSPRTHTGVVFGTPDYLSPEQAIGDAVIDGRSDVFAVGIVLFELLTEKRPFEAQTAMATAYRIVHSPAPLVESLGVHVDACVQGALDIALAKSKDERFGTAAAFADMLAPAAADGASRREALSTLLDRALAVGPTDRPPTESEGRSALAESVLTPLGAGAAPQVPDPRWERPRESEDARVGMAPTLLSSPAVASRRPEAHRVIPAQAGILQPSPLQVASPVPFSPVRAASPVPPMPPGSPEALRRASAQRTPAIEPSSRRPVRSTPRSQPEPSPSSRTPTRLTPVVVSPRPLIEAVSGSSPRRAGTVWSPRPLPRHVIGQCHARGSLIRAVGHWVERAHGQTGKSETLALVPREIADTIRADGYNALVWYDLATLDTYMQAATTAVMRGEVTQWRTLARENFDRDLASIFRVVQRRSDAESLVKRGIASWSKLLDFGTMRASEAHAGGLAVKMDGFDGASLALRYVVVGTLQGMLRGADIGGAVVRVLAGETSFARDFELEVSWHAR